MGTKTETHKDNVQRGRHSGVLVLNEMSSSNPSGLSKSYRIGGKLVRSRGDFRETVLSPHSRIDEHMMNSQRTVAGCSGLV